MYFHRYNPYINILFWQPHNLWSGYTHLLEASAVMVEMYLLPESTVTTVLRVSGLIETGM
jgi:hypothetical protein